MFNKLQRRSAFSQWEVGSCFSPRVWIE